MRRSSQFCTPFIVLICTRMAQHTAHIIIIFVRGSFVFFQRVMAFYTTVPTTHICIWAAAVRGRIVLFKYSWLVDPMCNSFGPSEWTTAVKMKKGKQCSLFGECESGCFCVCEEYNDGQFGSVEWFGAFCLWFIPKCVNTYFGRGHCAHIICRFYTFFRVQFQ